MDLDCGGERAGHRAQARDSAKRSRSLLAQEGVKLALGRAPRRRCSRRSRGAASELGAEDARGFRLDLQDPDSIAAMLAAVRGAFGDARHRDPQRRRSEGRAIHRAGIWPIGMPPIACCCAACCSCSRRSFRRCERSEWGRIVALTSTAVKQPIDNLALSNAFRTALVAALRTLAVEVAKRRRDRQLHRDGSRRNGAAARALRERRGAVARGRSRGADRPDRDARRVRADGRSSCAASRPAT